MGLDYSKSAVNLNNNDSVRALLVARENITILINQYLTELKEKNKELYAKINDLNNSMANNDTDIRTAVDLFGSYQDVACGMYAVKQRKVSVSYDAAKFKLRFPAYAPAIIIETVDTTKLNGLIKGGLITADEMRDASVIAEKESFAYIIKVDAPIEAKKEGK
jgi:hypothetical protein